MDIVSRRLVILRVAKRASVGVRRGGGWEFILDEVEEV